ncbi:MAG: 2-phospho-L-lactate guanylyltransferase [SAR86 cluster bacterium]|jgi:2-phospho-L-lactate guanylyltransferase|nr:2-phospho-L-lactate guanylyltransferase [SAR86 cluster bacterium]
MTIWSLVPIKSFKRPKSRLNDILSLDERRSLVRKMLSDVIKVQQNTKAFTEHLIVTEDEEVIRFAKKLGCKSLLQKKPGLNQGVKEGVSYSMSNGAKSIFIMHGDIPGVDQASIFSIINAHNELLINNVAAVTLLPDTIGAGTNCMICTPPNAIKFRYGIDSCSYHLEEAGQVKVKIKIHKANKLSADIDVRQDLDDFLTERKYLNLESYLNS